MAFTYRRPGTNKIWIGFKLPNGKQRLMSSGVEDEQQAMQLACSYERASGLATQKALTEARARKVIREIQMLAGLAPTEVETTRAFLEKRKEALRARFREGRTLERYTDVIDRFLRGHPELAVRPISEVTRRDAAAWRDHLQQTMASTTVNHHLSTLTREFKEALLQDLIEENPWSEIRVANAGRDRQQRRPFTWAQFNALLETTSPTAREPVPDAEEWHLFIKVAGYMGQRRMDGARLEADQIDLERRVVRFRRGKNKDWHEVPIHGSLLPDLAAAIKRHPQGRIMPALAARPATGRNSLSDEFRQVILPRIGIDQPYGEGGGRRKLAEYSIHSFRHALSTWLNEAGVSDVDRMRIVGHVDRDVSRGYTHAGLKQAHRAIAKLPRTKRFDRKKARR